MKKQKLLILFIMLSVFQLVGYGQSWYTTKKMAGGGSNARVKADYFGRGGSVVDGDIMVVAAHAHDYDANNLTAKTDAGAVYIYYKDQGGTDNWGQVKKLVATGTNARVASDYYGFSVAISGDYVAVGAYGQEYDAAGASSKANAGAVYIYYKNQGGTDNWGLVKKIVATGTNNRVANDYFGYNISISGDYLAVGAYAQDYDSAGGSAKTDAGAAYIFYRNQGGTDNWGQVKKVTGKGTNGRVASDNFGISVSISGDYLAVGARGQDYDSAGASAKTDAGAVYIFHRNSGGTDNWGFQKKRTGVGTNARLASDNFGYHVSLSGTTLAVGAYNHDYDSAGASLKASAGAVFVYYKDQGGVSSWGQVKKITPSGTNNRVASDFLGFRVCLQSDYLVVGAYGQDYDSAGANSRTSAGAAFVFSRNQGGADKWGQVKKLSARGTNARVASDQFGVNVGVSGNNILVTANLQDYDNVGANSKADAGAGYIYYVGSNFSQVTKISEQDPYYAVASDNYGTSVSIDGDYAAVGSPLQDYDSLGANSVSAAGAVYVYYREEGGSDAWGLAKKIVPHGTNSRVASDNFGRSVSLSGDWLIVGAPNQDYDSAGGGTAVAEAGAAYLFNRNAGGTDNWGLVKKLTGKGTNGRLSNDVFGYSVSISGDYAIVGAYGQNYDSAGANVITDAGAAYIFYRLAGGTNNWGLVKKISASGTNSRAATDNFGRSVSISGDYAIVGSHLHHYDSAGANALTDAGAAYIFYRNQGGTDNWGLQKKVTGKGTNGRVASDFFGYSVSISGDFALVGAYQQDYDSAGANSLTNAGASYLFDRNSGGTDNWGIYKKITPSGTNARLASDQFGFSVDITNNTLAVGANLQDYDSLGANTISNGGATYIFTKNQGGSNVWGLETKLTGSGTNGRVASDNHGYSVAVSGAAILVGVPFQDYDDNGGSPITDGGATFLYQLGFIHLSSGWLYNQPDATTGSYNAFVISGSPTLPAGAAVKNFTVLSGTTNTVPASGFSVKGTFNNAGTINGPGKIMLNGTTEQKIYGGGIVENIELNNSNGATIEDSLIVKGVLTHTQGTLVTNGSLFLKATGATTYGQIAGTGTGDINGNFSMEYQVLSGDSGWRPICSPATGASLDEFSDDVILNFGNPDWTYCNVYTYDESRNSTDKWSIASEGSSLDDSCFSIYLGPHSWFGGFPYYLDVTGGYYGTNDYTKAGCTYTGSITDSSGWHYVINPWPSGFLWDGSISNIQGNQVYLYDQNAGNGGYYRVYDNLSQGVIPPFTPLLVHVTSNNVDITLPNSKRITDSVANYMDKTFPVDNYIELGIHKKGSSPVDYLKFYTDPAADNAFEQFDGVKKLNDPSMPNIYFQDGKNKLNKQVYKDIPAGITKLPLLFQTTTNNEYVIDTRIENLEAGVSVYLEDLNVTPSKQYPITGTGSLLITYKNNALKYNLVIEKKSTTGVTNADAENKIIYISQDKNTVLVNGSLSANTQITMFDLLGRLMYSKTITEETSGIQYINAGHLSPGYYLVNIRGNGVNQTQKVIIK